MCDGKRRQLTPVKSGASFNMDRRGSLKGHKSLISLDEADIFDYAPVDKSIMTSSRRGINAFLSKTGLDAFIEDGAVNPSVPVKADYFPVPQPCSKCTGIGEVEERCKACRKAISKYRRDQRKREGGDLKPNKPSFLQNMSKRVSKIQSKILSSKILEPPSDDIKDLPADEAQALFDEQPQQVKDIVEALEPFFFRKAGGDRYVPWGRAKLAASVRTQVDANLEIAFVMLAFPFKFHNDQADAGKVIGPEADLAEAAAIMRLTDLCNAVSAVYPPGARLIVMSDGVLWNDLFDVPDEVMWRYRDACAEMAQVAGGRVVMAGLDRYFPTGMSPAAIRHALFTRYRPSLNTVKENRTKDENAKQSFADFQAFLTLHFEPSGVFATREQGRQAAKLVALEMLSREAALIGFMTELIPGTIRLSIRPKTMDSNAYTVNMLGEVQLAQAAANPAVACLATPWHNAAVVAKQVYDDKSGIYLARTATVRKEQIETWEEMKRIVGFTEKGVDVKNHVAAKKVEPLIAKRQEDLSNVDEELMLELQGLGEKLLSKTPADKYLPPMPVGEDRKIFSYKQLKGDVSEQRSAADTKMISDGLVPWAKEAHLTDAEFEEQLEITRDEFNKLLTCQQLMYKRKAKILG